MSEWDQKEEEIAVIIVIIEKIDENTILQVNFNKIEHLYTAWHAAIQDLTICSFSLMYIRQKWQDENEEQIWMLFEPDDDLNTPMYADDW